MTVGVIADDLTGAAELGGIGWRLGLPAEVFVNNASPQPRLSTRLVCIDSDSRSSSQTEAASGAQKAALAIRAVHPRWIYKKVDSVLRGHVVAEIKAIASALGFGRTLLVPANPSFGRIIRDGVYYLRGQPISETDFARDPHFPRTSSHVMALLTTGDAAENIRLLKPGDPLPQSGIVVGEASSVPDIEHWAGYWSQNVLCAGGAEFFTALLRADSNLPGARQSAVANAGTIGHELFVCGSTSDSTRRFVRDAEAAGVPVFYLPRPAGQPRNLANKTLAAAIVSACRSNSRVIISTPAEIISTPGLASKLSSDLVELAAATFRLCRVSRLFVEGGATAAALVRRFNWQTFDVIEELAPGVTTLVPRDTQLRVTVKPGSYPGWPAIGS